MEIFLVLLTFVMCFATSTLSGLSGGGAGFITMPYYIFIGLPPANALATSKLGGIGSAVGALTAFKGKGLVHKKLVVPCMAITLVCALLAVWIVPNLDPELFKQAIGVIVIIMIPTLFIKKAAFQPGERSKGWVIAGFIAYTFFSFLQTVVGTGMGTMVLLVLMFLFGLSALEATATRRVTQVIQAVVLVVLLGIQGLVVWPHAIAGLAGSSIGSHIGTHIAIKKGSEFVKVALAGVMLVSGLALLIW